MIDDDQAIAAIVHALDQGATPRAVSDTLDAPLPDVYAIRRSRTCTIEPTPDGHHACSRCHATIPGDRLDIIRDWDHPGPDADVIRTLIERRPCGAPVVQP